VALASPAAVSVAGAAEAAADPGPLVVPGNEPGSTSLTGPALREAIRRLDRSDTAVAFGLSVRREGRWFLVGGSGLLGVTVLATVVDAATSDGVSRSAPYIAATGIPAGMALIAVGGLPPALRAPQYLGWYAEHGPAPSDVARLKLLRRWRMDLLRTRRDAGILTAGFLGAASVFSAVSWGVRDAQGINGVRGADYDGSDAYLTLSFAAAATASGVIGLLCGIELRDETSQPHRLYLEPSAAVVPVPGGTHAVLAVSGAF
jgi:hypothetical protein